MKVYTVRLKETWADAKTEELREPILADAVNVLAGSGHAAIAVAAMAAKLKRDQGEIDGEAFDEKVVEAVVEELSFCCHIDLHE